jgi:hypothetical protein
MAIQKIDQGKTIKMICTVCKKEMVIPKLPPFLVIPRENGFRMMHARTCPDQPEQSTPAQS